jgi:hypothetical protein
MMYTLSFVASVPPIKKLSGLMSLCIILSSWTFSMRLIYFCCVEVVKSCYHLNAYQEDGLKVKLAFAGLEQIFEARAEHVHHHYVIVLLFVLGVRANIVESGHAS